MPCPSAHVAAYKQTLSPPSSVRIWMHTGGTSSSSYGALAEEGLLVLSAKKPCVRP